MDRPVVWWTDLFFYSKSTINLKSLEVLCVNGIFINNYEWRRVDGGNEKLAICPILYDHFLFCDFVSIIHI